MALSGPLTISITPKGIDKKRARKPKPNKTTLGEHSVPEPHQQHGEQASDKEPTPLSRIKMHARDRKVRATQDWVDGHIDSKRHAAIHKRANHVLKGRDPLEFRGTTGEAKPVVRNVKW